MILYADMMEIHQNAANANCQKCLAPFFQCWKTPSDQVMSLSSLPHGQLQLQQPTDADSVDREPQYEELRELHACGDLGQSGRNVANLATREILDVDDVDESNVSMLCHGK